MYKDEAKSFAKFLAYQKQFIVANARNYCKIQVNKDTGNFIGIFFALAGLQHAHKSIVKLIRFDRTYTASWFKMNLLIVSSVNANSKTLPLA